MKKRFLPLWLALLCVNAAAQAVDNGSRRLQQIADDVWERRSQAPAQRLEQGLPIAELPRWSRASVEAEAAFARDVLKRLDAINEASLSQEELLTLGMLRWDAGNAIEEATYFWLRTPVTPYAFYLNTPHRIFQTFRFAQPADAEKYLDLLAEYPRLIEELHSHLRRQVERGIVLPKEEVDNVAGFLRGLVREPPQSLFHVGDPRLAALDASTAARFKSWR